MAWRPRDYSLFKLTPFISNAIETVPLDWSLPLKTIPLAVSFNFDLEMRSTAEFLPHGKIEDFEELCKGGAKR